jgi:hypothetical protein
MNCKEFERKLFGDEPELDAELKAHAAACASCRSRMDVRMDLSRLARRKHTTWDSPFLWQKIQNGLLSEPAGGQPERLPQPGKLRRILSQRWVLSSAGLLLVLVSGAVLWVMVRQGGDAAAPGNAARNASNRLLSTQALAEVERTEAEYVDSINRLSELVEPKIDRSDSSLMINYREKLLLLDEAISECRKQVETNRYNAHLRRELLSIYREKHQTLQDINGEY